MKTVVCIFLIALMMVLTHGAPLEEDTEYLNSGSDITETDHVIVKRATCDLLGFQIGGFKLNDSACAAHCLAIGKRGGYCSKKRVCICRK